MVRHNGSYGGQEGLWELAVIKWSEEPRDPDYDFGDAFDPGNAVWGIVYDIPITDDVIGWLEKSEIEPILLKIKSLNKYGQFDEE